VAQQLSTFPSKASSTPQRPAAAAKGDPQAQLAKRTENAVGTFELLGAGLSLWGMMSSAKARTAFETAKDDRSKIAAQKAYNRAQTTLLDGAAVQIHGETSGQALAQMAQQNSFVAALVDRLELVNGIGGVAVSILPLVYQVVANHAPAEARDNMPPELMSLGVLPPKLLLEKLEAQNKAKVALAQAAILREQKKAEDELRRAQADIEKASTPSAS